MGNFLTHLDYVCVNHGLSVSSVVVRNDQRFWRSDHSPIHLQFPARSSPPMKTQTMRKQCTGWKPDDPDLYARQIMELLQAENCDLRQSETFSLQKIEETIETTADQCSSSTRTQREQTIKAMPPELRAARMARRITAPSTEARRLANNKERKLRRRWQARLALATNKRKQKKIKIAAIQCRSTGELEADRTQWCEEILEHCKEKYFVDPTSVFDCHSCISNLHAEQENMAMLGSIPPELGIQDVCWARARQKNNKTNGGDSTIVPEMITGLPMMAVYLIHDLFNQRFMGKIVEPMPSWHTIILAFLAKCPKPTVMKKDFRGVCLLDVFAKNYMGALMNTARKFPPPVHWHCVMCFAYEATIGVCDLNMILKWCAAKSYDWRGNEKEKLFIGAGDILSAFDNASIATLHTALKARQMPPRITAAILQELVDSRVRPCFEKLPFEDMPNSGYVTWNKCIRQGGNEASWAWNVVMSYILSLLVPIWRQKKFGVALSGKCRLTHSPAVE